MTRKPGHNRGHYRRNPEYYRRKFQRRARNYKELLRSLKDNRRCQDCGIIYPAHVMDFDHRDPSTKLCNVSQCSKSVSRLMAEVAKCDLVCANCHREREHQRRLAAAIKEAEG